MWTGTSASRAKTQHRYPLLCISLIPVSSIIFEGMKTAPGALILISLLFLFACKKESFITSPDARVTITADSLKYDTVFTTAGSVTQSFKIVNENDQKINISSVK